ncbi:MAG TPA: hypothetical protein VN643_12410 [Pyrinomonadaceae bacterium]|nr:hypothetical protein [Pyrinomonadaceae bacterium]
MNNDYLWDRTGEPDAEVQELEDVLGTLRYQPQPLVLPDNVRLVTGRKWYPIIAIAATIALVVLALGVWLRVQQREKAAPGQIANKNSQTQEHQTIVTIEEPSPKRDNSIQKKEVVVNQVSQPRNRVTVARHSNRPSHSNTAREFTAANRAEAEAAKEQLMLALRVVSAKLNFAQRKTVPGNNNVRYQHKVG